MAKRRGNGEGSIHKRARDGLWEAKYSIQTEAGPKRRTLYGKTRKEVSQKLSEALANRDKGIIFDSGGMTVSQYITRWLEDSAKGNLGHRTFANYKLQVRRHINPALGTLKLSKLNPSHIQSFYAGKLRDGLKPGTVRYVHAVLHRALEQAVRFSLIPSNPAAQVDLPKLAQDEITPLDADQARAFLDAAKGTPLEALYVISITTGLRMGEALGLKWSDIDLEAGTLRVNRQLQRKRRDDDVSGTLIFSEPKNASRRTIDLPQRALEALRSHRKRQLENSLGPGLTGRITALCSLRPRVLRWKRRIS